MAVAYPPIPYGDADFKRIRLTGSLYVDKTRFLRRLERVRFAVLIRPRRFGKSCWISLLEHYYDRTRGDAFDTVFGGTDIARQPTDERNRYVVLRFNFSAFNDTLKMLERNFEEYCRLEIRHALERNPDLFPEPALERILAPDFVAGILNELFAYAGDHGVALYVLIDEYDNVRQLRQHHSRAPRRGGLPRHHPRRRLLPQLLRHPEGRGGAERRRHRAAVHHRRVADHARRRDQRLQ